MSEPRYPEPIDPEWINGLNNRDWLGFMSRYHGISNPDVAGSVPMAMAFDSLADGERLQPSIHVDYDSLFIQNHEENEAVLHTSVGGVYEVAKGISDKHIVVLYASDYRWLSLNARGINAGTIRPKGRPINIADPFVRWSYRSNFTTLMLDAAKAVLSSTGEKGANYYVHRELGGPTGRRVTLADAGSLTSEPEEFGLNDLKGYDVLDAFEDLYQSLQNRS